RSRREAEQPPPENHSHRSEAGAPSSLTARSGSPQPHPPRWDRPACPPRARPHALERAILPAREASRRTRERSQRETPPPGPLLKRRRPSGPTPSAAAVPAPASAKALEVFGCRPPAEQRGPDVSSEALRPEFRFARRPPKS